MKVLLFTSDYPPMHGGISNVSQMLALSLSESLEIDKVDVMVYQSKIEGNEVIGKKLRVMRNLKTTLLGLFKKIFFCIRQYRDYDIIHVLNVFPLGFFIVIIGRFIFRKTVIVTFYGTDILSKKGSKMTKWAKRFTIMHATSPIAFSQSTQKEVCSLYGLASNKIEVISYPFPDTLPSATSESLNVIRKDLGIKLSSFVVLFVGSLVKRKGAEFLIKAVAKIQNQDIILLIVGDGKERVALEKLANELGIREQIIFSGKVESTFPFYEIAHVFSMPSYFIEEEGDIEGLGIVYLEAEHYNLPVIGTRSGGIPEAFEDGKSGFLVEPKDSNGIAEKINLLIHDDDLRGQMGRYGRSFVHANFSKEKIVKEYVKLYRSILK